MKTILERIVAETARLVGPSPRGLVLAVSGGPDSVALAVALGAVPNVTLVHVHHGLRGAEADADAESVVALGDRLAVPVIVERADALAESGGANIEAVARRLRYDALTQVARSLDAAAVLTGHTMDDQAETVLLRLFRGTGLAGLAGIRPRTRWADVTVARPLLRLRRAQLLAFLTGQGIPFRVDSSNADPRFERNRLRAEVMPAVVEFGRGDPVARLARLAGEARQYARLRQAAARAAVAEAELPEAGDWRVFHAGKLAEMDDDLLCELWRSVWHREGWPAGAMTRRHWKQIARVCRGGPPAVDCPAGLRVRRVGRIVRAGPGA